MGKRNAILSVIICFALTNLTNAIFDNACKFYFNFKSNSIKIFLFSIIDKELDKDGDIPANKNNYALNEICLNELQKQMNLEKHASLVYKQMVVQFRSFIF